MISSSKKLNRISRKWQKMTAVGRKRISLPGGINESMVAEKGHFVIYTADQKRHVMPLSYLSNNIFFDLLKLSEEEFGLSNHDPITLPCDSALFEYIVSWSNKDWIDAWRKLCLVPFLLVTTRFALLCIKNRRDKSHLFVDAEQSAVE